MGNLLQDFRYALRLIGKNPAVTLVAILSLGLGVGANTAMFSIINGVLLRPIQVSDPEQVTVLYNTTNCSYPDYLDYRDKSDVFSGVIAYAAVPLSMNAGEKAERLFGWIVSGNYFSVLGIRPAAGRVFTADDDIAPGAHPVAVISYNMWRSRFGSDPGVVGKPITLNGNGFTIVGVAQAGFRGTHPVFAPDVWVPLAMQAQIVPGQDMLGKRDQRWLEITGRLKPGVSMPQAQSVVNTITGQLEQSYPEPTVRARVTLYLLGNGDPALRRDLLPVAGVVMVMVGLVLLIACANVANILLARAAARKREIALRVALGASRRRLIRQLLTESLVLALLGGVVAVLVAFWATRALSTFEFPVSGPVNLALPLDSSVLLFTLVLSIVTGLVFGLLPALQASKPDVMPVLKGETLTASRGSRRFGLRNLLVMGQVAVSLILLIAAGLLVRSLQVAKSIKPGFDPQNVLTVGVDLSLNNYSKDQAQVFFRQLVENVAAVPGIRTVTLARNIPLGLIGDEGEGRKEIITEDEALASQGTTTRVDNRRIDHNVVAPNFFETLNIPVLRGRDFNQQDRDGGAKVGIINETMARRYWPNMDPLGKRFSVSGREGPYIEVVGVAQDSKYRTLGEAPRPFLYLPLFQNQQQGMRLLVRSAVPPEETVNSVRAEIAKLDQNLALFDVKTMTQQIYDALFLARTGAKLFTIFGVIGLLLAVVGLYGVISYFVAQRTQEIGIRMALGARRGDIIKLVIGQGMTIVMFGVALGLFGAFLVGRLLGSVLYGISASDPMTFLAVLLLLAGVALFANYLPARKALKVDPMISLRYE